MACGFPRICLPTHRVFSLVSTSCPAVGSTSLQTENCVAGIPVDSRLFVESGWFTAYSTGEDGHHGANVGIRGRRGERITGGAFPLRREAP